MADQSFLVKIVLNMHHKCSQSDNAHNSVNRSHKEQCKKNIPRLFPSLGRGSHDYIGILGRGSHA